MNGNSSTTSDDRQPSDDDDFDEEYSPQNKVFDAFLNGELEEEDDDDDDDYVPRPTAKTVAKCYNQSQVSSKPCLTCSRVDQPDLLLLCEDCDDAYHIGCLKPELLSVPSDDWYCPLCEHKRLCDGLIEKLIIALKDYEEYEVKRKITASKRQRRLTNVTVNIEPPVKPPVRKRLINVISSSDDTENDNNNTKNSNNNSMEKTPMVTKINTVKLDEDDDDDDSVYGRKNDENRKPAGQVEQEEDNGKRRVRSCRRKTKNYCLDEYDKKFQDALANAGPRKDSAEDDSSTSMFSPRRVSHEYPIDSSDESVQGIAKRKATKKRSRYDCDDDMDASDSKHDADFVPSRRRSVSLGAPPFRRAIPDDVERLTTIVEATPETIRRPTMITTITTISTILA